MIRDREIERLIQYAQGLGIQVTVIAHKRGDPGAEWDTITQHITLYKWPRQTKRLMLLNLLHELAHHMAWIYTGRQNDPKTDLALATEAARDSKTGPIPKPMRKLIYVSELNDSKYREQIYHEVGLKMPLIHLHADIELDIWTYNQYYLTGDIPTLREACDQKRLIYKRLKNDA